MNLFPIKKQRNEKLFIIIFLIAVSFKLHAQEQDYTQSGYTSLTIQLSGYYPKSMDISPPHIINPLSLDKATKFQVVDDSTLMLSFFTFGPSSVYFNFNRQYLASVLLPNQSDVLRINYEDSTRYTIDYQGHFKEIFDNSSLLQSLIIGYFNGEGEPITKKGVGAVFKNANAFRDSSLVRIAKKVGNLSKSVDSKMLKQYYLSGITDYAKITLIGGYDTGIKNHNKAIGLDSLEVSRYIPKQDSSYYDGILNDTYADTLSLMSSSYCDFLGNIRKDSLLNLPAISSIGADGYHDRLKELFGSIFSTENNLFYDMMVANAYLAQITNGELLSNQEKLDVNSYFKNKQVSNYILHQNDVTSRVSVETATGKYYFPFDKAKESVMADLLSRYKGKVIVMDFWATWCGPCIAAFDTVTGVKERFADRDDVVFIYVTDESSDYTRWSHYVNMLGGEHYYLYNDQSFLMGRQYKIRFMPSYLVFNKKGRLSETNVGDMGKEKMITWIEKAMIE